MPEQAVKRVAAPSLILLAPLVVLAGCDPGTDADSAASGRDASMKHVRLVFRGAVSSASWGGGSSTCSMSATRVLERPRTGAGGLIVYRDIMELAVEKAAVTHSTTSVVGTLPRRILDALGHVLPWKRPDGGSLGLGNGGGRGRPRVVFDGLDIQSVEPGQRTFQLSAERGKLSFDPDTLVLAGSVAIATPAGEELRSPRALLSRDFEGIHLPAGYQLDGKRFAAGALVIGADGRLAVATHVPEIRSADLLERTEGVILSQFADKAPGELRALLLALLAHAGSGALMEPRL